MFLGVPVLSIAYWCVDQEMAQRVLAGKNLNEVRLGTACASLMKILPPFITSNLIYSNIFVLVFLSFPWCNRTCFV